MFFIVNKRKKHITLGDISITLGPRQAIDLDRVMERSKSEKSKHLKSAQLNGDIEIRIKDKEQKNIIPDIVKSNKNDHDLEQFKDEILREMRGMLSNLTINDKGTSISREELLEILQSSVRSNPTEHSNIISKEDDVLVSDDLLSKINARTVDKMLENTSSNSFNYKEEKQENTILNNIDELENLLG